MEGLKNASTWAVAGKINVVTGGPHSIFATAISQLNNSTVDDVPFLNFEDGFRRSVTVFGLLP